MGGALGLALQAQASLVISYSTGGVGPTIFANGVYNGQPQPGDSVEIQAYSSSLTLADNTPTVAMINNLHFIVDYTWPSKQAPFSANRGMTINTVGPQTLTQGGLFDSWFSLPTQDQVWLFSGGTTTFNFAGIGTVAVTPIAMGTGPQYNGTFDTSINATFLFTPVPEPTTLVAGALLLLPFGVSTLRMLRRRTA